MSYDPFSLLLASATVDANEETGIAMADALTSALDSSRPPVRIGPSTVAVTLPARSRHKTVGQGGQASVAMAELTASMGTQICVGGAWCSPTDEPDAVADRAWIALSLALARASATPVIWERRRHAWLASPSDASMPAVDPPLGRIRGGWATWSKAQPGRANGLLVVATYMIGLLAPFLLYLTVWTALGWDPINVAFWVVFGVLMLTTGVLFAEALLAIEPGRPPRDPERWPSATALIPAWLPNEHDQLVATLGTFLDIDYPGGLQVVCAYNTDRAFPEVEADLRRLAETEPRLTVLRVEGSRTKAQNLNAALTIVTSEMVGVFDADHHPGPEAFGRAARWIAAGWDGVQGRCTVRLAENSNLVQRLVATEFETIYGVAHPGRARRDRFAIFGGSNGYWRTPVLKALRFAPDRLTEDIDLSARSLLAGARLATDRAIISSELPPADLRAFWGQRGRWAQGWTQVSRCWLRPLLRADHLTLRQKLGVGLLFGLREVTPWFTLQIFPILAFHAVFGVGHRVTWFLPFFVFSTILSLGVAAWQTTVAWAWADPFTRSSRDYIRYVMHNVVWFSELKMLIGRVAHLRAMLGETQWKVTRRAPKPVIAAAQAAAAQTAAAQTAAAQTAAAQTAAAQLTLVSCEQTVSAA